MAARMPDDFIDGIENAEGHSARFWKRIFGETMAETELFRSIKSRRGIAFSSGEYAENETKLKAALQIACMRRIAIQPSPGDTGCHFIRTSAGGMYIREAASASTFLIRCRRTIFRWPRRGRRIVTPNIFEASRLAPQSTMVRVLDARVDLTLRE